MERGQVACPHVRARWQKQEKSLLGLLTPFSPPFLHLTSYKFLFISWESFKPGSACELVKVFGGGLLSWISPGFEDIRQLGNCFSEYL